MAKGSWQTWHPLPQSARTRALRKISSTRNSAATLRLRLPASDVKLLAPDDAADDAGRRRHVDRDLHGRGDAAHGAEGRSDPAHVADGPRARDRAGLRFPDDALDACRARPGIAGPGAAELRERDRRRPVADGALVGPAQASLSAAAAQHSRSLLNQASPSPDPR